MFTTSFNEKNAISVKKNFPASIFHVLNCFIENEIKNAFEGKRYKNS